MKRTITAVMAICTFSAMAAHAADSTKINGWISDSMCGAKHAGTGAACVKKCIGGGSEPVFVDEANKAVWKIDNPDTVKAFYGSHVTVTGTPDKDAKTLHVDAVAAAK